MTLRLHVQEPYFSFIKSGSKKVEGRQKDSELCALKPGALVIFFHEELGEVSVKVKAVRAYPSLNAFLEGEGVPVLLPDCTTLEEGRAVYFRFYTEESIQKAGGMLAIEIEVQ
uniref:ASCH domain-containing protein n=1 Tax=Chromera velia CCMP2878 TaxID=1169474 RepID=A0A0G4HY54_9ALVE|eukprot:Cvel_33443.t1-p1 / transcript=Cvel_33443.t1 / gene=Cvel_33443 / organism=Chromera_velia_CCMP2878 / gene_product=hypothetical protein / transcript_product=hypothetical protein / location=Cvel_scaffold5434:601-936(-) / protein_length=112 / sequence_SO=supercontig / SO=protein_coding / is_pseudo=false